MGNDAGISKFKYLSTVVDPGKYFTGYEAIRVIALDFVSRSIDICIDREKLKTSNYIKYSSYITVIINDINSDYKISFEADILNPNIIDITAFSSKDDKIIYRYKNGNEYGICNTIEDEYYLMKDIVKEIVNSLKNLSKTFVLIICCPDIITNKFASDFE